MCKARHRPSGARRICPSRAAPFQVWSYLEPLFAGSDEVKRELPMDAARFLKIDEDMKNVLRGAWTTKVHLTASHPTYPPLSSRFPALSSFPLLTCRPHHLLDHLPSSTFFRSLHPSVSRARLLSLSPPHPLPSRLQFIKQFCQSKMVQQQLANLREGLAVCKKSLAQFLEGKRAQFPRFFFISEARS